MSRDNTAGHKARTVCLAMRKYTAIQLAEAAAEGVCEGRRAAAERAWQAPPKASAKPCERISKHFKFKTFLLELIFYD